MRSFQVLLAGSNPATRLISSFYLIPNAFLCEGGFEGCAEHVSLLCFTKEGYQTRDTGFEGKTEVCEAAALTGCVP